MAKKLKRYIVKEFQRLKENENDRLKLDWNLQRTLARVNYSIHTDAIFNKMAITQMKSLLNSTAMRKLDK